MFYSAPEILLVLSVTQLLQLSDKSHKRDKGFGIYTPVQQRLRLLICSLSSRDTGLIRVSPFTVDFQSRIALELELLYYY